MVGSQWIMNKNFHEDENGFLVITSSDTSSTKRHVPLECPICGFLMRDNTDVVSFHRWNCCDYCYDMWVDTDPQGWKSGKRPSLEEKLRIRKKRLTLPSYGVR